jgi:hypothetical protein
MRESEEINHAMMIMASKATKSARIPEASVPKNGKKAKGRKLGRVCISLFPHLI